MITITEKALEHVVELMMEANLNPDTHYLKVGVAGGGCSGLSYVMDFTNEIKSGDEIFDIGSIKILVDKKSLLYIWGTELNYSDGLNGKGFEWRNPNASRTCGCGESFSV